MLLETAAVGDGGRWWCGVDEVMAVAVRGQAGDLERGKQVGKQVYWWFRRGEQGGKVPRCGNRLKGSKSILALSQQGRTLDRASWGCRFWQKPETGPLGLG